jgi:hypothetical protein
MFFYILQVQWPAAIGQLVFFAPLSFFQKKAGNLFFFWWAKPTPNFFSSCLSVLLE